MNWDGSRGNGQLSDGMFEFKQETKTKGPDNIATERYHRNAEGVDQEDDLLG